MFRFSHLFQINNFKEDTQMCMGEKREMNENYIFKQMNTHVMTSIANGKAYYIVVKPCSNVKQIIEFSKYKYIKCLA